MKIYNVICPVCGFKYKSTETKKRWDGVWTCEKDWEVRHPIDFYNVKAEDTSVPFVYPNVDGATEATTGWASTLTCVASPYMSTAFYAISGCAVPGIPAPTL